MKSTNKLALRWLFSGAMLVFLGWISAFPIRTQAQGTLGNNAVYNSGTNTVGSSAWIDASVFSTADVCAALNAVFRSTVSPYPTLGAVIDARGVNPGTTQTCSISPWSGVTTPPPSTILLPSGTIVINNGLTLPNKTRLIGAGGGSLSTSGGATIIQAGSSFPSATMFIMGSSALCGTSCTGISLEDLWLDGQGQSINGILNQFGQELSYVKRVTFYQLLGTALSLTNTNAVNSGPYSDLAFSLGSHSAFASSTTACVQIKGISTRGLHGVTCIGNTGSSGTIPNAGVLLDASNNSLEDIHVEGFGDGVRVGSNASAQGDVLFNISGGANVTNVVNITNSTGKSVSDLSLMAITNGAVAGSGGATNTIADSRTSTTLADATVGMYVLGKAMTSGSGTVIGESRFTSSPNAATWGVGSVSPSGTCKVGSLFSNTSGTAHGSNTWWVCTPSGSTTTWTDIN
jgi:hypothetical protein